jgi:hypothetical protein
VKRVTSLAEFFTQQVVGRSTKLAHHILKMSERPGDQRNDVSEITAGAPSETRLLARHLAVQFLRTVEETESGSPLYRQQLEDIGGHVVAYSEDKWHADAQRIFRSLSDESGRIDVSPGDIESAHMQLIRGLAAHESKEINRARAAIAYAMVDGELLTSSGASGISLEFTAQSDGSTPVKSPATPNQETTQVVPKIYQAATFAATRQVMTGERDGRTIQTVHMVKQEPSDAGKSFAHAGPPVDSRGRLLAESEAEAAAAILALDEQEALESIRASILRFVATKELTVQEGLHDLAEHGKITISGAVRALVEDVARGSKTHYASAGELERLIAHIREAPISAAATHKELVGASMVDKQLAALMSVIRESHTSMQATVSAMQSTMNARLDQMDLRLTARDLHGDSDGASSSSHSKDHSKDPSSGSSNGAAAAFYDGAPSDLGDSSDNESDDETNNLKVVAHLIEVFLLLVLLLCQRLIRLKVLSLTSKSPTLSKSRQSAA